MEKFNVIVEFSGRDRPGDRLTRYVVVEAEDEVQAKAKAGVGVISNEAHKLHAGNIAGYSDVQSTIHTGPAEWEDPSRRDEHGKPVIVSFESLKE